LITYCPFAEKFLKSRIYFTAIYGGVSLKPAIYGGVVFGTWNAYRNPAKNATAFSNFEQVWVSSQYFGAKPNAKSPRPKVAKIFE
jgi:hypothetical protein